MWRELKTARKGRKIRNLARICDHSFTPDLIREDGVILDCGANRGDFASWVADAFPHVTVYAFEPDPRLFPKLPKRPNVTYVEAAVTGNGEPVELWMGEERCSSISSHQRHIEQSIVVNSITLEKFCEEKGIGRIDLIKLDIERAELEVLEEANPEFLSRVGQITVEFHDFLWKEDVGRIGRCVRRMRRIGFQCFQMSWHDHSDVLFLNGNLHGVSVADKVYIAYVRYQRGLERKFRNLFLGETGGA
ncbi:MAG: hypothetical protein Kow006_21810 [Gammaproteobacteria bacterium]